MAEKSKLEKYSDIQALVQKEIQAQFPKLYAQEATKYGVAKTPLHRHNGLDSPRIKEWDIESSLCASGRLTMSTAQQRYYIGLNTKPGSAFKPSSVRFNGIVVYPSTSSPTRRALICGDAYIGSSFYLQPATSSSAVVGGTPQVVVQSSSYLLINGSGAPATQAQSSEGHIVSVTFDGDIVARLTIPDLGQFGLNEEPIQGGSLVVYTTVLETDWHIIGSFQIK